MKKILLLAILLFPLMLLAQEGAGKKNKNIVILLKPLKGERANFEKGLAQHCKLFHSGDNAIDIYEVISGDRTGEFHFVYRNQFAWADIESVAKKADEKSHDEDWTQNVDKYIDGDTPRYFYEISDNSYLSSDMSEMNTEMLGIYLIETNPGMEKEFDEGVKKIAEMYRKNNSKSYFLMQTRVFGKENQVVVVFPLPKGLASLEPDPNDDWSKMFKKAFPKEDFGAWIKKFNATQKSFESLLVRYRKDLSTPM